MASKRGEPSASTVKTLFAHSNNVCAFPGCEVPLTDPVGRKVWGRLAHIYGENSGSARYDEAIPVEVVKSFDNIILLCPNHHTLVDDVRPDLYPVEVLQKMKDDSMRRSEPRWLDDKSLDVVVTVALQVWGYQPEPEPEPEPLVSLTRQSNGQIVATNESLFPVHAVQLAEITQYPQGHRPRQRHTPPPRLSLPAIPAGSIPASDSLVIGLDTQMRSDDPLHLRLAWKDELGKPESIIVTLTKDSLAKRLHG